MTDVGFIGLGAIGKPMALRLARSYDVTVFDVAPDPIAELQQAGASAATSVAELATSCDVICVMVRDDEQVRDVLGQIYGAAKAGTTVVIHSTVAPETPAALEKTALRHDLRLVDAPVSGGSMGAADGTLAIMVGGSDEAYDHAKPVLEAMGSIVTHAGPIGSGTKLKLARNLMHFVSFTAATEAQRLAEAAGLDLVELGNIVRHTDKVTGGPGAIMLRDTAAPIAEDDFWHGVMSHVVALGEKDLSFAISLGETLGVETPMAELALARLAAGLGVPGGNH